MTNIGLIALEIHVQVDRLQCVCGTLQYRLEENVSTPWRVTLNREGRPIAEICCLHGLLAPKPYVPHQNSLKKGISLGCRLVPEMILIGRNCAV